MEQNGTICKQNQTKYKHQQEQDDDFQKSNFCVKENREYLKINYYLKKHENFHINYYSTMKSGGFGGVDFATWCDKQNPELQVVYRSF